MNLPLLFVRARSLHSSLPIRRLVRRAASATRDVCQQVLVFLFSFSLTMGPTFWGTRVLAVAPASSGGATLSTDRPEYSPGGTAVITGSGFAPGELVTVQVVHSDGDLDTVDPIDIYLNHEPWTVTADRNGSITTTWYVAEDCYKQLLLATAYGQTTQRFAAVEFTDADTLDGWLNKSPGNWGSTGNGSNSTWAEDQVVPMRFVMGGLTSGQQYDFVVSYDFLYAAGSTKHFYDGLATYNTTVTPTSLPSGTPINVNIPADTSLPGGAQLTGQVMKVYGASVGSVLTGYSFVDPATQMVKKITFRLTASSSTMTILYGGHIASASIYGSGNGASSFPGASGKMYGRNATDSADKNFSLNPNAITGGTSSVNTTTAVSASNVTYPNNTTATVTVTAASGTAAPTGSVTLTLDGTTTVGTSTLTTGAGTSSTASFTITKPSAGGHTLSASYTPGTGFNSSSGSGNFNVTAKTVTASFTAANKTYDGNASATVSTGPTLSGVDSGDTANVSISYTSATFADKNVANGKTVTLNGASLSGNAAGNYSLTTPVTTTANITAKTLTVTATGQNKVYDGNTTATVTLSDDRVSGDVLTVNSISAAFASATVGTGKSISVTGITVTGTDAGNYSANTTATATANITVKSVTATVTANNKTYDGTTTASASGSIPSGLISGDSVNVVIGAASFDTKNVGNGKTVTATGLTLAGSAKDNYTLTSTTATTTANITGLTVTGSFSAANKEYDGTTTATASNLTVVGKISGDDVSLTGGTAMFGDKNVGNNKTVTLTGATLVGNDAGNYSLASISTTTANITAKAASVTPDAKSKVYNTNDPALTGSLSGFITGDNVGASYSRTQGETVAGGPYTISATLSPSAALTNYSITYNTASFTITPATATISFSDLSKTYNGSGQSPTVTTSPAGLTYAKNGFPQTDAASYPVSATVNDSNYTAGTASATFVIGQATSTISVTGGTWTYDGQSHAASVTVTPSNLPVTVTYNGSTTVPTNAGTYAVVASTVGNQNYAGSSASTTITINKANATFSISGFSGPYDGNAHGASGTATGVNNEDLTSLVNFGTTYTNVPGGTAHWTFPGNDNYNPAAGDVAITITKASATVTLSDLTKTYNGAAQSPTATTSPANLNVTWTNAPQTNYGSYNVAATIDDANYQGSASDTFIIQKKTVAGTFTAANKVYDGTVAATATSEDVSGKITGDDVTLTGGTATFDTALVGNGKTVTLVGAALSGAAAGNYQLSASPITTTANITKAALTITVTAENKVYDGTTAATISDFSVAGAATNDNITAALGNTGTATFSDKNAGNGKTVSVTGIVISGTNAANYSFNSTASTTADITKRPLTISATVDPKTYDGGTAATGQLSSNKLANDDVTVSGGTWNFASKNAGTQSVSITGITVGGADKDNYSYGTSTTASGTINKRTLTVGATGVNKIYDGTTTATVTLGDDRVGGDQLTLAYGSATFVDKNVGTRAINVSGITVTGTDAGNYNANTTASASADITPKHITGSFTAAGKTYDGTTSATVSTRDVSGKIGSDDVNHTGGTATFADKNVGTGKTVTLTGATLTGAAAGNYVLDSVSTTTADITKASASVTPDATGKVYGGSEPQLTGTLTGFVAADNITASYSRTSGETVAGSPYTISATLSPVPALANYSITYNTANFTITPATATISFSALSTTYNGSGQSPTVTTSPAGLTYTKTGFPQTDAASYPVTATVSDSNYTAATTSGTFVIGQAASTINATGGTWTYDGQSHAASVTVTPSGLPVTVTYNGSTTVPTNAGTYAVIASTTGNQNYAGSSTSTTITINKANATFNISGFSGPYDGSAHGGSGTATGVNGENLTSLVNFGATFTNVPGGTAHWTFAGNDNYNPAEGDVAITITKASATVTLSDLTKTYNGAAQSPTATTSPANLNVTWTNAPQTNYGSYNVTATIDDANYQGSASDTFIIQKKIVTGTVTAANKTYDGTAAATVTSQDASGKLPGDDVTLSGGTATFDTALVGNGKTVTLVGATLSGVAAGNYQLSASPVTTTANITKASLTISVTAANKVYDGTPDADVQQLQFSVTGAASGDTITAALGNGGTATFNNKNAGDGKPVTMTGIVINGTNAANYSFNNTASTTADITKRPLTISATVDPKTYDGGTAATGQLSTNKLGNDDVTVSGGTWTFGSKNAGPQSVSITGITVGGADKDNYSYGTSTTASGTINKRTLTVGATGANKIYDGNTTATVTLGDNRVGGDQLTLGYGSATFADKNVGTRAISVAGITVTGLDAGNYNANTTASASADITPKHITGSFTAANKTYDGTTAATVSARDVSGKIGSDEVNHTGGTATFDTKNVGTGKTVTLAGAALTGAAAGNYVLDSMNTASADITKASASVTPDAKGKVYGGSEPELTGTLAGFVPADNITASYSRTPGETVDGSPYTISATLSPTGALDNYAITYNTASFTITKKTATITAVDTGKTYGGADPQLTVTPNGFLAADLAGITLSATRATGETATTYVITPTATGGNVASYDITPVNGTFTISKAHLTVTADDKTTTYNGQTFTAFTATISGFVNNETSSVVSGSAGYTGAATTAVNAGDYAITPTAGNLSATNYDFPAGNLVNGKLTIGKASSTTTVTVTGAPFYYTGSAVTPASVLVTGAGNLSQSATPSYSNNINAGTATASYAYAGDANHNGSSGSQTFTISPADQTISFAPIAAKTYGDPAFTVSATASSGLGVTYSIVSGPATISGSTITITGAGTIKIGANQAGNSNYNPGANTIDVVVNKAALAVTADNKTRVYGTDNPVLTASYSGFVYGETLTTSGVAGAPALGTTAAPSSVVGAYPITAALGSLTAANYRFVFASGTLAVTARPGTVAYIGQTLFITSGSSSTTAQVTLSASVADDGAGTLLGNISAATVTFTDLLSNKVLASGVKVSQVSNTDTRLGTANTIATLSTGQYGAQEYLIEVKLDGCYKNPQQTDPTDPNFAVPGSTAYEAAHPLVTVAIPATKSTLQASGSAAPLSSAAGTYGLGKLTSFTAGMQYNNKGTNTQGKIELTIDQADGTYYIKSNSITSVAFNGATGKDVTIYTKASIYKISGGVTTTIDGNVTLRTDMHDGGTAGDTVGFTVLSSKDSTLYYSNNWVYDTVTKSWKTVQQSTASGSIVQIN